MIVRGPYVCLGYALLTTAAAGNIDIPCQWLGTSQTLLDAHGGDPEYSKGTQKTSFVDCVALGAFEAKSWRGITYRSTGDTCGKLIYSQSDCGHRSRNDHGYKTD